MEAITMIRNETNDVTSYFTDMKIRIWSKSSYANKFDNLDKMDKFLKRQTTKPHLRKRDK